VPFRELRSDVISEFAERHGVRSLPGNRLGRLCKRDAYATNRSPFCLLAFRDKLVGMNRVPRRSPPALQPVHWFILSAAAPLVHCASRLNLDLWHDEIYTVDVFVGRGPAFIVTDYSAPNNHVLFSLLLWPFYCLSDSTFMLRLPSFLCTLGTLAIVFHLARRCHGLTCAVLCTSLLGLNQMFLIHTIQVRGYGLSMLLTAWLAALALPETNGMTRRRRITIVLVGAAFLYVLPTNVLFFAPLAAVAISAAAARRSGIKQVFGEVSAWLAAAVLALVCYLPIVSQILAAAKSSSPSSWTYLPVIAANFFRPATHDYLWFAPLMLGGLIAVALPRGPNAPRHWALPVVAVSAVLGAFLLTGLLRISPFERLYCPLLVPLALGGGWLLAELTEALRVRLAATRRPEVAAGMALGAVSLFLWPQLWTYPQRLEARRGLVDATDKWGLVDGYYCYYAANYHPSAIVRFMLNADIDRITYRVYHTQVDTLNLAYYFAKTGLPMVQEASADGGQPPVAVFAILPEPANWKRLAGDCGLTPEQVESFRLIEDFGYYRLYQRSPSGVGSDAQLQKTLERQNQRISSLALRVCMGRASNASTAFGGPEGFSAAARRDTIGHHAYPSCRDPTTHQALFRRHGAGRLRFANCARRSVWAAGAERLGQDDALAVVDGLFAADLGHGPDCRARLLSSERRGPPPRRLPAGRRAAVWQYARHRGAAILQPHPPWRRPAARA
jgi:hypothetical protein